MAIRLTDAEQHVLVALVECGGQRRKMAEQLNMKRPTVGAHMTSLFRKTASKNSVQLLRWALTEAQRGTIDRPRRIVMLKWVGQGTSCRHRLSSEQTG